MGAPSLVEALEAQDDALTLGMPFAEGVQLAVDEAPATFNQAKVEGLIRRAGLRCPNADVRRVDLIEQRGLDRAVIAQLGTCAFVGRRQNVVLVHRIREVLPRVSTGQAGLSAPVPGALPAHARPRRGLGGRV